MNETKCYPSDRALSTIRIIQYTWKFHPNPWATESGLSASILLQLIKKKKKKKI